jgi:putative FmdB family regulatory protein
LFQGINDPVETKCPQCGKRKLRRLFGAGAGIIFKGSGFYQTDYRSDSYRKSAAKDSKSSTGDGGGTSKSSDGAAKTGQGGDAPKAAGEKKSAAPGKKKSSGGE